MHCPFFPSQKMSLLLIKEDIFLPVPLVREMVALYKAAIIGLNKLDMKYRVEAFLPFVRRYFNSELSLLEGANFHRDHANPYTMKKIRALRGNQFQEY